MHSAILLIAHGSRVDSANADIVRLAEMVAARQPKLIVEHAYLELAEPTIGQGFQACVERGATDVRMLPWFLSAGAHVSNDLEAFRQRLGDQHAGVRCLLCPPLGLHPLMADILLDRMEQAE